MRILIAHNAYQQAGGEDAVAAAEASLLRDRGHDVALYQRHNDEIVSERKWSTALGTIWSRRTVRDIATITAQFRPDIIHVHNTFPLISPSLYWAAARHHVPVVQTLHNFRLLCPQAIFLRDGRVCESCNGRLPWRGIVHRCYRQSTTMTAVLAGMLGAHRAIGTYNSKVTRYIALNDFCRRKFIEGGLPEAKIVVKPNFVSVADDVGEQPRAGGLFVGRLSTEKGVSVLLEALPRVPQARVDIIGVGDSQEEALSRHPQVRLRGWQEPAAILQSMRTASYLVMPSICYESFPRTLVEAYACGLPVIASRLGGLAELIVEGVTGLLFEPGSALDLAAKIAWAEANPEAMRRMGENARERYRTHYTPTKNYEQLVQIYRDAVNAMASSASSRRSANYER